MLLKQFDKWVRRLVGAKHAVREERRSGRDRRSGTDRRKQHRTVTSAGVAVKDRRNKTERRVEFSQLRSTNEVRRTANLALTINNQQDFAPKDS